MKFASKIDTHSLSTEPFAVHSVFGPSTPNERKPGVGDNDGQRVTRTLVEDEVCEAGGVSTKVRRRVQPAALNRSSV